MAMCAIGRIARIARVGGIEPIGKCVEGWLFRGSAWMIQLCTMYIMLTINPAAAHLIRRSV
jgi:hypothetical protein